MKRDKKRVEGEVWGEAHLEDYLNFSTYDGTNPDFHCLYRAYTRMNEETFARFVSLFRERGRNVHATNLEGQSLANILQHHSQAQVYLDILGRD
ncbi:PA4642 family protein [Saccharospirillum impatiens]|uniref:PA4642 family protein n=1 Tax=Saccharospirillum impatiens TaxID=169438 RepID=UPI0003FACCDC|nr:PA4642 family protein [Saccharospirillum impatiens]